MREIRTYGSEGGAAESNRPSLPLSCPLRPSLRDLQVRRSSEVTAVTMFPRPCELTEATAQTVVSTNRQVGRRLGRSRPSDGLGERPSGPSGRHRLAHGQSEPRRLPWERRPGFAGCQMCGRDDRITFVGGMPRPQSSRSGNAVHRRFGLGGGRPRQRAGRCRACCSAACCSVIGP